MPYTFSLQQSEKGNATLFAAAIIPLAISLTVLAVDVSAYQSLRERAQREADRIVLQAARALPDVAAAERIVSQMVSSLPDLQISRIDDSSDSAILLTPDSVSLALEGGKDSVFDYFLPREQFFTVREHARAVRVPQDTIVVLADGYTLRPPAGRSWGEENEWPASKYFNFIQNPNPVGIQVPTTAEAGVYWPNWSDDWNRDEFRRWVTQSCFNPIFSILKLAAISIVDVIAAGPSNRLAIAFTPGDDAGSPALFLRDFTFAEDSLGKLHWVGGFDPVTYFGDEGCLLLGHPETSSGERYALPPVDPRFRRSQIAHTCEQEFLSTGWGGLWYPSGHVSECYRSQAISERDLVYYHASRSTFLPSDGSHVVFALQRALALLLSASDGGQIALEQLRGGLANAPRRRIILISDVLPGLSTTGMTALLGQLERASTELIVVAYHHEGLSEYRSDLLTQATSSLSSSQATILEVIEVRTGEEFASKVIPAVLQKGQEYVLSR